MHPGTEPYRSGPLLNFRYNLIEMTEYTDINQKLFVIEQAVLFATAKYIQDLLIVGGHKSWLSLTFKIWMQVYLCNILARSFMSKLLLNARLAEDAHPD